MVSATSGTPNSSPAGILLSTTTPSVSSASFTQQLAAALEQYLGQSNNAANLEIDVQPSQSQNSGGSQFLVTVKSLDPAASAVQTAHATPAAVQSGSSSSSTDSSTTSTGSNNTSGGATTPAPAGYENVPFGLSATTVPGLDMQLAAMNKENGILAQINPDALSTASSQAGDPMNGQSIPNTNLKWNDLTQNQQIAYEHALLCGLPAGQTMDQFLASHIGPSAWWNASYSNPNMFGTPPAAGSVNMHSSPYIDVNA